MKEIKFPYGKEKLSYTFDENNIVGILTSSIEEYVPEYGEVELVKRAMENPVESERLSELAKGKKKVVIIASDHTRPVPSKIIIPLMLDEIRKGNPDADITILVATGCHRSTTKEELVYKFGEDIIKNEKICIHDCDDESRLTKIGVSPTGNECKINTLAYEADLLVSEGFIEPHFFAGFSGGRKSVLPGISARTTVLANHCSEFVKNPCSRTGILEDNPIHNEMLWTAKQAKLCFIVNVVLNSEKKVIYAVAGDTEKAHKKGTDFILSLCAVKAAPADIVISTNGGYPLDQNVYQSSKGMTAAEATVNEGGVVIMLAASNDGMGGDDFYHQLADEEDINKLTKSILNRERTETLPDQWQTQVLLRVMSKAKVIYISEIEDDLIRKLHMIPAHSIKEALEIAYDILGNKNAKVTLIPEGISVIVKK